MDFDDTQVFHDPKYFQMQMWSLMIQVSHGSKVISNYSMEFNDPKVLNDPQVFADSQCNFQWKYGL